MKKKYYHSLAVLFICAVGFLFVQSGKGKVMPVNRKLEPYEVSLSDHTIPGKLQLQSNTTFIQFFDDFFKASKASGVMSTKQDLGEKHFSDVNIKKNTVGLELEILPKHIFNVADQKNEVTMSEKDMKAILILRIAKRYKSIPRFMCEVKYQFNYDENKKIDYTIWSGIKNVFESTVSHLKTDLEIYANQWLITRQNEIQKKAKSFKSLNIPFGKSDFKYDIVIALGSWKIADVFFDDRNIIIYFSNEILSKNEFKKIDVVSHENELMFSSFNDQKLYLPLYREISLTGFQKNIKGITFNLNRKNCNEEEAYVEKIKIQDCHLFSMGREVGAKFELNISKNLNKYNIEIFAIFDFSYDVSNKELQIKSIDYEQIFDYKIWNKIKKNIENDLNKIIKEKFQIYAFNHVLEDELMVEHELSDVFNETFSITEIRKIKSIPFGIYPKIFGEELGILLFNILEVDLEIFD